MDLSVWLCFFVIFKLNYAVEFNIPDVKLEAFSPSGIRASIPALPGIELFGFHGKINQEFKQLEPGDFTNDIRTPTNGYFIYENPNLKVKVEDELNYWVFVQHNQLGYRLDNQKWKIKELKDKEGTTCQKSSTVLTAGETVCSNTVIFQDEFTGNSLDINKWILHQYIPQAPDYEFVIYKKDDNVTQVKNNQLIIKPKLQTEEELMQSVLDLGENCTKDTSRRAKCSNKLYIIQNPIVSGRIESKTSFSFGHIEIKAKLASGDWMYPQIYLEDENHKKLVIAYSRGNVNYVGNDNIDIGGSLLFGGPMLSDQEPNRSEKLSSYRHTKPLSNDFHEYGLKWTPHQVELYFDKINYGTIPSPDFAINSNARLVLGVGIGGITDFPNDFKSDYPKPWRNLERDQVKKFYEAKDKWSPSWNTGGQLQIDYIRIRSL